MSQRICIAFCMTPNAKTKKNLNRWTFSGLSIKDLLDPDMSHCSMTGTAVCSYESSFICKQQTVQTGLKPRAEETRPTFSENHVEKAQTLSGASPLFDDKQVFICRIRLFVPLFAAELRSSASLGFSFVWMRRRRRLPEPGRALWSALFFRGLLWFFKPLPILSFASASGKISGFV